MTNDATVPSSAALEFYNRGCEALTKGDWRSAAHLYRQCLLLAPDLSNARFNLGYALRQSGEVRAAITAYRQCFADDPGDLESGFNLASCLCDDGDMPGAIVAYRAVRARHPRHLATVYNLAGVMKAAGDTAGAAATYRECIAMDSGHLDSWFNLGSLLRESDDLAGAAHAYEACLRLDPGNADAIRNLTNIMIERGNNAEAVSLLQQFCTQYPEHRFLTASLALARWRLRMSQAASSDAGLGLRRILVACMPKSGSTFLADLLSRLPGMQRVHLVPDYGRREQELDLEQLVNHAGLSYVTQLHLRPSKLTLELISAFGLKPVFLYRNIWDVMASMRDHMFTHSLDWSMAQIDAAFRDWDEGRQYEFLARAVMPWFIDFYVSWWRQPDRLAVRYEDLIADPQGTMGRVAAWAGITASSEELGRALAETGHSATFNKGGSGRGKAVPAAARAHVEALAGFYPDVDFAPLMA